MPIALYEAETWSIAVAEKKRLNVIKMRCLSSVCRVTRMDRVRNEEVRRRASVAKELAGRAEQSTLRWHGHMERIEEDWLTKRIVRSDVRSVRLRGRPRTEWMDHVKRVLN